MVDTLVLGTSAYGVGVQVPPGAPKFSKKICSCGEFADVI